MGNNEKIVYSLTDVLRIVYSRLLFFDLWQEMRVEFSFQDTLIMKLFHIK